MLDGRHNVVDGGHSVLDRCIPWLMGGILRVIRGITLWIGGITHFESSDVGQALHLVILARGSDPFF